MNPTYMIAFSPSKGYLSRTTLSAPLTWQKTATFAHTFDVDTLMAVYSLLDRSKIEIPADLRMVML